MSLTIVKRIGQRFLNSFKRRFGRESSAFLGFEKAKQLVTVNWLVTVNRYKLFGFFKARKAEDSRSKRLLKELKNVVQHVQCMSIAILYSALLLTVNLPRDFESVLQSQIKRIFSLSPSPKMLSKMVPGQPHPGPPLAVR